MIRCLIVSLPKFCVIKSIDPRPDAIAVDCVTVHFMGFKIRIYKTRSGHDGKAAACKRFIIQKHGGLE